MNKINLKIFFLVTLSFLFYTIGLGQKFQIYQNDTINRTDKFNKKQKLWIYFFKDKPEQIEKTGVFVDNRKSGIWKTYYSNGKLKSEITYKNNRPNGYAKIYYENGNLSEEGIWKGTKWVGEYKFYHENGNRAYEWKFDNNGKRTGEQKYFYEDGSLRIKGEWIAGKENGVVTEYYENGNVKSEKYFAAGKFNESNSKFFAAKKVSVEDIPDDTNATISKKHVEETNNQNSYQAFDGNGYHKLFNAFKKVDREGEFKDGRLLTGKRYFYNSDGVLIKTMVYKNGRVTEVIRN